MIICCLYLEESRKKMEYGPRFSQIKRTLESLQMEIIFVNVDKLDFSSCVGCFDCWVKSPGKCVFQDGMHEVLGQVIRADVLLIISPIYDGFLPAVMKQCFDRMIPLLHPYLELVNKEVHHRKRYPRYPKLAMVLDLTDEDSQVRSFMQHWGERLSLNMRSRLLFFRSFSEALQPNEFNKLLYTPENTNTYG
ncbi:MAG: flavodoxin family protein [Bacteroidota bacterium]